ncbi:3-oxoacyl-ACP synthase [Burkholderia oklahomensis]|uniref:3-oxoacyl-ACP synthase n=1 Tax=Burkholderia oklahomensis TaxID=342113 RepID=UPI00264FAA1C|nr:3-oxoacyl-ACP synthase [Burkholderia oklahomensis]MDN7676316.1 3-oxoacyl-ACP synthase [Burkholderia oklahomensis]
MLTIHHNAIRQPSRQTVDAAQAAGRYRYDGRLAPHAIRFAMPCERLDYDDGAFAHLARSAPASLPVETDGLTLSDLALAAVRDVVDAGGPSARESISHIVVAQASLNEQAGESVAGRMQHALGLKHVVPFALGQCGTLGFYAALPLASGLLRQGGRMLFVAADKWVYPFLRAYGDFVAYGDGAAAILLGETDDADAGARVLGHALAHGDAIADPWAREPAEFERALVAPTVAAARAALGAAGVDAAQIDCFAPSGFSASFRTTLAHALAIAPSRVQTRDGVEHLSTADTPRALARAQASLARGERRLALFCDTALAGGAGALVAELRGAHASPSSTRTRYPS